MADNNSSGINDGYATPQTINFIEGLKTQLSEAENILSRKQVKLKSANDTKSALNDLYMSAQAAAVAAQSNLEEAEKAQKQINIIAGFFKQRIAVTGKMVDSAKTTAVKMYEATEFVGKQGLERIDKILEIAVGYNKKDSDKSSQWTSSFITAVQTVSAKGQTALNSSIKATKDAFGTLVTTLQIDSRTNKYYQQCQTYQKMMVNLINRLSSEYLLLKVKADKLGQKVDEIEMKLSLLNTEVQVASFNVAQLKAEYTAAQKGASYTGSAAAAK